MGDIVDRLRGEACCDLCDEAADEIKRLRTRIEDLETALRIEHANHPELP